MYSNIFDKNIHSQKYLLIFYGANLFRYLVVIFLSCQICSEFHLSFIYGNKYIWIFICQKRIFVSHWPISRWLKTKYISSRVTVDSLSAKYDVNGRKESIYFLAFRVTNWQNHKRIFIKYRPSIYWTSLQFLYKIML